VAARFEAYGWHVQTVATGDSADVSALRDAVSAAQGATDRPSLIKVQTTIGYGAAKQGTHDVHGAPIGAADIAKIKGEWGFDPASSFYVDPEVAAVFAECRAVGKKSHAAWSAMFARCDPSTLLALTALSLTLSVVL
jgi:transketolase